MNNHTPGPWKLAPGESSRVYLIDGPDGAVGEFVDCRKQADARLIAAAPELANALAALLNNIEEDCPQHVMSRHLICAMENANDVLWAAGVTP